jgi:hypothetical protein
MKLNSSHTNEILKHEIFNVFLGIEVSLLGDKKKEKKRKGVETFTKDFVRKKTPRFATF